MSVSNNVFLFLYSASENIHHPLIETDEIMDLTVFAQYTVETTSVYQFCILFVWLPFTYKSSLIEVAWSERTSYLLYNKNNLKIMNLKGGVGIDYCHKK